MKKTLEVFSFKFRIMDKNGKLLDSGSGSTIHVVEGRRHLFKPVEKALPSLSPGQKTQVFVASKEGFGEYNTDLVVQVPQSEFETPPQDGEVFEMEQSGGSKIEMRFISEKNGICVLDGNHFLAGVDLIVEIESINRRPATENEVQTGNVEYNKNNQNKRTEVLL